MSKTMKLVMLTALCGAAISLQAGDEYEFPEKEANRLIKAGFAKVPETAPTDTAAIDTAVKSVFDKSGKGLSEKEIAGLIAAAVAEAVKQADANAKLASSETMHTLVTGWRAEIDAIKAEAEAYRGETDAQIAALRADLVALASPETGA